MRAMRVKRFILLSLFLCGLPLSPATAQSVADTPDELWQRQRERDEQLRRLQTPEPDVRLDVRQPAPVFRLPSNEQPCFVIDTLRFDTEGVGRFGWLADAAEVDADGRIPSRDAASARPVCRSCCSGCRTH